MFVSEISFWGAVLVACLVLVASIALAFIDRQMLRRMLVIFGATVVCDGVCGLQGACLSDQCLVGLYALVPVGTVFVNLLGLVSCTVFVEKDAAARKCCDVGGQYRGRRQCDAVSAH